MDALWPPDLPFPDYLEHDPHWGQVRRGPKPLASRITPTDLLRPCYALLVRRADMQITPNNIPFHIARAYGQSPPPPIARTNPTLSVGDVHRDDVVDLKVSPSTPVASQLVAAKVEAPVHFASSDNTSGSRETIPFYRHPADRNSAATSIVAGKVLDVSG